MLKLVDIIAPKKHIERCRKT